MVINATLPTTLECIKPGEIYERRLFSPETLKILMNVWRIRRGTIQDRSHAGVVVLQFVAKRKPKPEDSGFVCPNCGEEGGQPVNYDFGIELETGYHDAGTGCTKCTPEVRR